MEEIRCRYIKTLYFKDDGKGYRVALYGDEKQDRAITVTGYYLPVKEHISIRITGEWVTNKYGKQFAAQDSEYVIEPTEAGIKAFLTTLVTGVGDKMAAAIFKRFGTDTMSVFDKSPERLLEVPGIKEKTYRRIIDSYQENRGAREVVSLLRPYGIAPSVCVKVSRNFPNGDAIVQLHDNPYQLTQIAGIGFHTADKIGAAVQVPKESPYRIAAAVRYVLKEAESGSLPVGSGHLCLPVNDVYNIVKEMTESNIKEDRFSKIIAALQKNRSICLEDGLVFRACTYQAMTSIAINVAKLVRCEVPPLPDLDDYIETVQEEISCFLAPEQAQAVNTALTSAVSVITGGPGTGKTMIIRCILSIYQKLYPDRDPWLMAPTGRAARRMTETTGHPASTIHSALGLRAGNEGEIQSEETPPKDAKLVIVDETSMLDVFVAEALFKAFTPGTQIILIGDADQLPSVGPGAVLSDLLKVSAIPSVRLTEVFRQAKVSRIAINAAKMRRGNTEMDYGDDFQFVDAESHEEAGKKMADIFVEQVAAHGLDSVVLLSPFRKETATGVNQLNELLQERLNPVRPGEKQVQHRNRVFRVRDRVMVTKNDQTGLSNGDIGYVIGVHSSEDDPDQLAVEVDFDFGDTHRTHTFCGDALNNLDLAYATTIHKSQGSEYKIVIMTVLMGHYIMLKRNLIYTGVTRGRETVIIVGQKKALTIAVKTEDAKKRLTNLPKNIENMMKQNKVKCS